MRFQTLNPFCAKRCNPLLTIDSEKKRNNVQNQHSLLESTFTIIEGTVHLPLPLALASEWRQMCIFFRSFKKG